MTAAIDPAAEPDASNLSEVQLSDAGNNASEAAIFGICGVLVHFFKVWPPVAIFGCAALCLALFMLDISGAYGNWCHVAKYGDFTWQDRSVCGM